MTKLKITYLTTEDISSGLFSSQVLTPIKRMAEIDPNREFLIFVINRPWKYFNHRKVLKDIHKSFNNKKNISLKYIPFLPPLRNITRSKLLSKFVINYISILIFLFTKREDTLYHARGYLDCAAGLLANLKPMIFEPRSLWTLENVAMGTIIEGSSAELYWTKIEKMCSVQSNKVVSINEQMANYLNKKYNLYMKDVVIPISYSDQNFSYRSDKRKELREKLFLNNKKVFVYSGSLGMTKIGVNSIIKIIFKLKEVFSDSYFLFLTPTYESTLIKEIVKKVGLNEVNFKLIHPRFGEISDYLSAADYGYHAIPAQPDSFSRMGTKIVEYLAVGLPAIVNENVGAAASILNAHNLGITINENSNSKFIVDRLKLINEIDRSERINFAKENFEVSSAAKKYLKIYEDLENYKFLKT